ncbi:Death ligand signal enhancer [Trichoplax sp. H2]|nr:Death ligand signal enhancer [Trichoplax sp. H2]|eukprot:RDD39265.1 Death ligand signal enhancer [Trichoplax sp. H2]
MSFLTSLNKIISANKRCISQVYTQRSSYFQSDSSQRDSSERLYPAFKYFTENEQCQKSFDLLKSVKGRVEDSIKNFLGTNFTYSPQPLPNDRLSSDENFRQSEQSKIGDEIAGAFTWTGAAVVTNALMQHTSKNDERTSLSLSAIAFCRVLHALGSLSPGRAATLSVLPANIPTSLSSDDQESSKSTSNLGDKKLTDSLEAAMRKFSSSMKNSSAASQNALAILLQRSGQHKKAVEFFRESSSQGYSKAQYNMGLCYHHGYGVGRNIEMAVDFYERAALQGHPLAQYNYGIHLMENGNSQQSMTQGIKLLKDSAGQGIASAQYYLGQYYLKRRNYKGNDELAVKYFKMAADQLDVKAQYYLAICYEKGVGVEVDLTEARKLYETCVDSGYVRAITNLGKYYENGLGGLKVDKAKAISLYRKATCAGSHKAKSRLEDLRKEECRQKVSENGYFSKEATLSEEIDKRLTGTFFPAMINDKDLPSRPVVRFAPTRRQGSLMTETSSSESDPEDVASSYNSSVGPLALSALFTSSKAQGTLAFEHP